MHVEFSLHVRCKVNVEYNYCNKMTRFARAKGSKASNERAPEDGTPWEVMKEQLLNAKKENEDAKKREEAEKQRIENYENFLKEHKTQKRKATWCDFPEANIKKTDSPNDSVTKTKKKKVKKNAKAAEGDVVENVQTNVESNAADATEETPKKKKKKNKPQKTTESQSEQKSTVPEPVSEDNQSNKKKNKKKNKNNKQKSIENTASPSKPVETGDKTETVKSNSAQQNNQKVKEKKIKKLVNGKPVRRKEINDNSFQLIVHGREIELVRFDGFPVMKKDAERLQELKTNMMKKGIPKSEVQRTIKLERRRAEKALARIKREVCYNCRKGGHVLSDCPELKTKIPGSDLAEGVCFKCGSTEHRQFECKVQRDKEFRFATCFICKEPGHIARQCPDNPKGLYPNGGSCKLCGDVTHLRKDCPTATDKKEESSVKLHTLDSTANIEDVGQLNTKTAAPETTKKPKKITF
ncbi:unnamed protein product [Chrysodeixis includens]|uniref:CCHC-type domain-containing protein n=1 Tax=Chrysodeixis includens TaxID=689277 RepID=A0A9N8Q153_CHRIL|nr:unnamed protein product [Chrysodeixis includens]